MKGGIIRMENENTCHCCKKKDRSDKERKDLMNRLSRIEGQIRATKRMGQVYQATGCAATVQPI